MIWLTLVLLMLSVGGNAVLWRARSRWQVKALDAANYAEELADRTLQQAGVVSGERRLLPVISTVHRRNSCKDCTHKVFQYGSNYCANTPSGELALCTTIRRRLNEESCPDFIQRKTGWFG